MKAISKEWKEEQSKDELKHFMKHENMFDMVFQEGEIVGVLTGAYYYELEDSWETEKEYVDYTLDEAIENVDERIIYEGQGLFHVVEHGQVVDFYELWASERDSVLEHFRDKMEKYMEHLEEWSERI